MDPRGEFVVPPQSSRPQLDGHGAKLPGVADRSALYIAA